jgi:predicted membrane protein
VSPHYPGRAAGLPAATPQFVFGVIVMLIGSALLLDNLGLIDAGYIFRAWPLALVAFGVMHFTRGAREHRFWGVFWIIVGSWLFLRSFGVIDIGFWQLFLPLVLISFGVSLVMRTLKDTGHMTLPDKNTSSHLFAVFGGSTRKYDGQPFEGAYMTAVMGGCELDLRRATMAAGQERSVVVFALMGGHGIKVPAEWEVVNKVVPVFGGVEDKRVAPVTPPVPGALPAPRLIVEGTVIMGGLELKS